MIQIRIAPGDRYSIGEMGQMAVEGGCGWLVVSIPDAQPGDWRDVAAELVPLCRDAGVILTVEDNVEAVRELEAHGVYLHAGANAVQTRQDLGPEAIVGAQVASAEAAVALAKADIDYVTLAPGTADAAAMIETARKCGAEVPFVAVCAAGDVIANAEAYLGAGYAGFYVTEGVFDADDPVALVEKLQQAV